jgi:16S rRNA (cytosine1402-N4)-methyltransferase
MRTRFNSPSDPVPSSHRSVLLHEVTDYLDIHPDEILLDATLGGAGHARELASRLGPDGTFVGFDLDRAALDRAREALSGMTARVHLVQANFRHLEHELQALGISHIDKALYDLGWSGYQLAAGRGFSFLADEPLRMTYAEEPGPRDLTAEAIVNEWGESSIADVLFGWGEERYARRIAKAIVEYRVKKPIRTTRELAELISRAVPPAYAHGRIHPATRTFQALRIATNDELGAVKEGLASAWKLLSPGGRIAVITFHSIEDREVKRLFVELEKSGGGKRVNRSVVTASKEELSENPRARSAKLRVIEKTRTI